MGTRVGCLDDRNGINDTEYACIVSDPMTSASKAESMCILISNQKLEVRPTLAT
jgi:hypothetical protein